MIGRPIPDDIQALVDDIKSFAQPGNRPPLRRNLKHNDNGIMRQNFEGARGILREYSALREWFGDERLFDKVWWEYLCVWRKKSGVRTEEANAVE